MDFFKIQKKERKNMKKLMLSFCIITMCLFLTGCSEEFENAMKEDNLYIISNSENGYADEYGFSYYIEGIIKNDSDKNYSYIQVTYNVFDKDGNNIGTCLANNNNVMGNSTWKFKAICSGNADDVKTYKLVEITGW